MAGTSGRTLRQAVLGGVELEFAILDNLAEDRREGGICVLFLSKLA